MYRAATEIVFRAGHWLQFGSGRREEPHEHDWRIRAVVGSPELDTDGLVMDFEGLGQLLHQIVQPLSQERALNDHPAFKNQNPSAEHLARYIYDQLKTMLPATAALQKIVVWEQEDCRASYQPSE